MPKPRDFIPRTMSAKIITQTVLAIAMLLIPIIIGMVIGTRMIIKEEVGHQVDQALNGIAYRIDNTLLNVEQTAAILRDEITTHLDRPQDLGRLCRNVLETNPSISGCAIALNPDKYTFGGKPFMTYVHRAHGGIHANRQSRALLTSDTFTDKPFTEQTWYTKPIREGVASWVGPLRNEEVENEPLISYDVPIVKDSSVLGVLGIDMSLDVLTHIAQNYRTSTHSHITILAKDGSYIVHPDSTRLLYMNGPARLKDNDDPSVMEARREMVEGKSGRRFLTLDSTRYLVAYMPFRQSAYPKRKLDSLGWSIAVVYPEKELYDEFDPGFRLAIIMTLAGLFLLTVGAYVISRISLRPLRRLMYVTKIISNGNYRLPGFETSRQDEVGRLQTQYNKMLQSVSRHMEQLQDLSQKEDAAQNALAQTYARTQEIKKQRAAFFSNMTHQMADVTAAIQNSVDRLNESGSDMSEEETRAALENIERNGHRVTEILNDMLNMKG